MKKKNIYNRGAMEFGMEILIFVVIVFILWVFTGGANRWQTSKPYIKPLNDPNTPGRVYGPGEN